jgi:hypothetical protein
VGFIGPGLRGAVEQLRPSRRAGRDCWYEGATERAYRSVRRTLARVALGGKEGDGKEGGVVGVGGRRVGGWG